MLDFVVTSVVQAASVATFLSLVAFLCCLAAEFKRARVKDLRLDGNLCSLPGTPAFGLGVAALVCLLVAQIVGTSVSATRAIFRRTCSRPNGRDAANETVVPLALLVFSWIIFGVLVILLGTASSMNHGQPYGRGWLDGECYVVRRGVYLGSATLVLPMVISILGYMFKSRDAMNVGQPDKLSKAEANQKIQIAEAEI